jgi:6-hydroxytryprostatin B O-methyltransferase
VAPAALRWITHFKIAEHVPSTGSISYTDLATAASVPEAQLKRILRYTMLNGYFTEPTPSHVSHTAMSLLLASNSSIQDYVGHSIGFSYPVSTKMVEMTERFGGSDAKNETAFNVAYDTPLPMFAWLKGEPEHYERFGRLMGAMRQAPIYSVKHLVEGYDWASVSASGGKVVDVGGSLGHTSLAIAEKNPGLSFVVQDLPEVVEQGRAKVPDAASKGLEFVPHDFFKEQPVKDADIYLLRQILHDWPDAEATTILKNLVASMKPGAKIVIMDQVVPPPGLLPNAQEKAGRVIDLVVMSHFNGKQRDLEDWKRIFNAVDDRLVLSNLIVRPGSVLSIIELFLHDAPATNGHTEVAEETATTSGVHEEVETEKAPVTNGVHGEGNAALPTEEPPTGETKAAEAVETTAEPIETENDTLPSAFDIPSTDTTATAATAAPPSAIKAPSEPVEVELSAITTDEKSTQSATAIHATPIVSTAA